MGYHIVYSVTPSVPQGFYLIVPTKTISRHDIVEFIPPAKTVDFIRKNRWAPQSGSIIKYAFALPNDHVCIKDEAIFINGKEIGPVYKFYAKNKLLPQNKICGTLKQNQYFLLSTKSKRSFDSRYFGAILFENILGRAIPLIIF